MKYAIAVMMLTLALWAQTAKVVELKPDEAAQAKRLHDALAMAQKAADDFDHKIAAIYVTYSLTKDETGDPYRLKEDWIYGFEFSEDFRFIVPKPYQAKAPVNCGFSLTPAVGITAN